MDIWRWPGAGVAAVLVAVTGVAVVSTSAASARCDRGHCAEAEAPGVTPSPSPAKLPQALLLCVRDGGEDPVPQPMRLKLSHATRDTVHFTYATIPGTAVGPGDYLPVRPGSGSIPPNALGGTILITINVDQLAEETEWFTLRITSIEGATMEVDSCPIVIRANKT